MLMPKGKITSESGADKLIVLNKKANKISINHIFCFECIKLILRNNLQLTSGFKFLKVNTECTPYGYDGKKSYNLELRLKHSKV